MDVGILGSLLGRREPVVEYRTIDGGHPAPYPDMTDEQLYNYEMTFNVSKRTFDKPPPSVKQPKTLGEGAAPRREPPAARPNARDASEQRPPTSQRGQSTQQRNQQQKQDKTVDASRATTRTATPAEDHAPRPLQLPPLDLSKPVRLITSKQPVEIITTRARHPVYKVHGYIGDDDVVTLFTLDGQLSENGPRFLENIPQHQQLYLNIYVNQLVRTGDRFRLTQHATRQEADAAAKPGRVACVPVQFDM